MNIQGHFRDLKQREVQGLYLVEYGHMVEPENLKKGNMTPKHDECLNQHYVNWYSENNLCVCFGEYYGMKLQLGL